LFFRHALIIARAGDGWGLAQPVLDLGCTNEGRPGSDGGFPAFLRERNSQLLQELLRDIVQRDIASRYHLREIRHLMNLALFLLANTGLPLSMQSLTKSLSIPTVAQTARFLQYFA
jgi:predicted AAA+ superfamily ATPase